MNKIEFTRVANNSNNHPRYVCHFLDLLTSEEKRKDWSSSDDIFGITTQYNFALARAKKIGGRKFHNKQYGGGIVFVDFEPSNIQNKITQLLNA